VSLSLIDAALLAALLGVCGWRLFAPGKARPSLIAAAIAVAGLAGLQLVVEGFYWQFLAAYLLGVWAIAAPPRGPLVRRLGQIVGAALMLAALAPWALLPIPTLTRPTGAYAVGSAVFRWVDPARMETATTDPGDRRNVVVQAWYPAVAGARGPGSIYMDGLDALPGRVSLLPSFVFRAYAKIDTHAVAGAQVAGERAKWPVVVFSPGYGAPRAFYTSLATGLASRGYVVLALDHPYEAAVTELADGRIATTVEVFRDDDPDRTAFMAERLKVRVADVKFVLDQLGRSGGLGPLTGRLDLEHVAATGHSFGGATAAVAAARDPRIKAAANIDGTLYGDVAALRLRQPFLLLESDHTESGHSERYLAGNRWLLATAGGGSYHYEIHRANHYSFTDAPLFFSAPGRFLLARLIGGGRGPRETHRATTDMLAAFLQGPLTGRPASVESAVRRYRGVTGGRVRRPQMQEGGAPVARNTAL
jgi:predicted dienelactone hydrolase